MQPARVWLRKSSLDRRIAQGADPHDSPELARRARQLSSRRWRTGLAAGLRRMVEAAEEPRPVLTSQVPLNRREILAERELFLELARDLSSSDDLRPRGIACVERLLTDSYSPCFATSRPGELGRALRQARAALHLT
jgi:hypothetical protein